MDARDAGKGLADSGPAFDLPAETNPVYPDPSPDAGLVVADSAPDTSIPDGHDAGGDSAIIDSKDTSPDAAVLGPDAASPDTATPGQDAGRDGSLVQKETAAEAVGQDAAADGGGPLACSEGVLFGGLPLANAGDNPDFLAVGDLNGDGKLDIVTGSADRAWDTVSVLLGNGDGTFAVKTDYYAGFRLTSLLLGDIDADGSLDIVTTGLDTNAVSVLLGNGDGTFPSRPVYTTGKALSSGALGDLNGDGKPDLVATNVTRSTSGDASTVRVLLGKGDGTFLATADYPSEGSPIAVTIVDLDGDGGLDIVYASSDRNTLSVLLGRGDGTFAERLELATGIEPSSALLWATVGDPNGDGKPDIVVIPSQSGLTPTVLVGKGGGDLPVPQDPGLPALGAKWATLRDLNGDGKQDLTVASDEALNVYLGNGDATFAGKVSSPIGSIGTSYGLGDFDGDGKQDLAVALDRVGSDGSLEVLQGKGDGGFGAILFVPANGYPDSVAVVDLDGDGWLDIVTASSVTDAVGVSLASGEGGFAAEPEYASGDQPVALAVGDLDGDGRPDVVTANNNGGLVATNNKPGTVSVLLGTGAGKLAVRVDYETVGNTAGVALGDLNSDRQLDVVAVGYDGSLGAGMASVLLGTGGGKLAPHVDYPGGYRPGAVAIGDVNGDGKPDLVVANAGVETYFLVSVLLGKGDGTFAAKVDYAADALTGPTSVALADLNGDGKLDIVLGNTTMGRSVSVLLGRGDGSFPAAVNYPVSVQSVAVGDVNGDGKLDIMTGFTVLLGAGDVTFPSTVNYSFIGDSFALGDMNGDGKLDLVTTFLDGVSVLINSCVVPKLDLTKSP